MTKRYSLTDTLWSSTGQTFLFIHEMIMNSILSPNKYDTKVNNDISDSIKGTSEEGQSHVSD